jgi:hypothetical protein
MKIYFIPAKREVQENLYSQLRGERYLRHAVHDHEDEPVLGADHEDSSFSSISVGDSKVVFQLHYSNKER